MQQRSQPQQPRELTPLGASLKLTGVFRLTAKRIEGTDKCDVQIPCRYSGKTITIAVYED